MLVGEVRCATPTAGRFLNVVRRQPMVVRTDVRLEVRPRPARQLAQEMQLVEREPAASPSKRTTDPPGNGGRRAPQQEDGPGDGQCRGMRESEASPRRRGDGRGHAHRPIRCEKRRAPALLQRPLGVAGGAPLEQAAVREQHPSERADDGVKAVVRFIGKKREREQRLPGVPPRGGLDGGEMLPEPQVDRLVHQIGQAPR